MEVVTYPSIDVDNYRESLWNEKLFSELLNGKTVDERVFKCKKNQAFIKRLMQPYSDNDSLLLFHLMGSGKTDCAIITYDNLCDEYKKVVFILKGANNILAVRSNIIGWVRRYKKIYDEDEINKYIVENIEFQTILSFSKKITRNVNKVSEEYNNCIFIVDEAHDLRVDSEKKESNKMTYQSLCQLFQKIKKTRLVLMTGTPMYDNSKELLALMSMLHTGNENYDMVKDKPISELLHNRVSYYYHKGDKPSMKYVETDLGKQLRENNITRYKLVVLQMRGKQLQMHIQNSSDGKDAELKVENSFMRKLQAISLAVTDDYEDLVKKSVETINQQLYDENGRSYKFNKRYTTFFMDKINTSAMKDYSIKFHYMAKKINECEGTVYIFSELVEGLTTRFFIALLLLMGYEIAGNTISMKKPGKRMLILTANETINDIGSMSRKLDLFNSDKNVKGDYIKIIIGSTVSSQSLTFKNVRQVHILTPHWNIKKIDQVETRVVRIGSHELLEEEDRNVDIYRYVALATPVKDIIRDGFDKKDSTDLYKYIISEGKEHTIKDLEEQLIDNSIDLYLTNSENKPISSNETNAVYINYYRNSLRDIFSQKIYDLIMENNNERGVSLHTINKKMKVDKKVISVMLHELSRNNRFIHVDGSSYKLMHSDNYFYVRNVSSTEYYANPDFEIVDPIDINYKEEEDSIIDIFDKYNIEFDMIHLLRKQTDRSVIIHLTRGAISRKNYKLMSFVRNLWVYVDNKFYECSSVFVSSNSSFNLNQLLKPDIYVGKMHEYDEKNNKWIKCNESIDLRMANELYMKVKQSSSAFSKYRETCYVSYYGGQLYIRNTENDIWLNRDSRKVYKGMQINIIINLKNKDPQDIFTYIFLETVGLCKAELYAKSRESHINISRDTIVRTLSDKLEFRSNKDNSSTRKIIKSLYEHYPNAMELLYKFVCTSNKDKKDIIEDMVLKTGSYYLR